MGLDDLGNFNIGGSINTQFETSLGIERVMIGLGKQAGGLTSFLTTLEFIGYILLIFWGVLFIAIICFIHIVLFLCKIYKYFYTSKARKEAYEKAKANGEFMTDEEVRERLAKFELTEEEEEEVRNFH